MKAVTRIALIVFVLASMIAMAPMSDDVCKPDEVLVGGQCLPALVCTPWEVLDGLKCVPLPLNQLFKMRPYPAPMRY